MQHICTSEGHFNEIPSLAIPQFIQNRDTKNNQELLGPDGPVLDMELNLKDLIMLGNLILVLSRSCELHDAHQ